MTTPEKTDYHVHYFVDGCVDDEMTPAAIAREAERLGLEEICVLKHYSHELPNGEAAWVHWKRIAPAQFERFLDEMRPFRSASGGPVTVLAGVETELLDETGEVNIPEAQAAQLDALILSVHWLPRMAAAQADPALVPGGLGGSPPEAVSEWRAAVAKCGAAVLVEGMVAGYVNAMGRNTKVKVLAHMYDGLKPLRDYGVPVDELDDNVLLPLMEPLMRACAEGGVLWELMAEPVQRPAVLARANELGVRFTATADAHFLRPDGWASLCDHHKAEEYIASLGLTRGRMGRDA